MLFSAKTNIPIFFIWVGEKHGRGGGGGGAELERIIEARDKETGVYMGGGGGGGRGGYGGANVYVERGS